MSINFPAILINLSVKNIYILMNLINLWTGGSSNIYLSQMKLTTQNDSDFTLNTKPKGIDFDIPYAKPIKYIIKYIKINSNYDLDTKN